MREYSDLLWNRMALTLPAHEDLYLFGFVSIISLRNVQCNSIFSIFKYFEKNLLLIFFRHNSFINCFENTAFINVIFSV